MKRYLLRRLGQSVLVIVAAMIAIFIIGHVLGDPVNAVVSEFASIEEREAVRDKLGFNDPILVQFGRFAMGVIQLDFGTSPVTGEDALGMVMSALPNTAMLGGAILLLALPIGFVMGAWGAFRPGSFVDRAANVMSLAGISVVEFWLGLTLITLIAVPIGVIPTGGTSGALAILLPAMTGAFRIIGRVAQFSRSALLEEYSKPYVEMARAKGLSDRRIFLHVSKNAATAIITVSTDEILGLVNGVVVIETVFAWPGVGRLVIDALGNTDLFVLQAAVFTFVVLVMVITFIIDLTYMLFNPRVRYE
ncbi:ABC transporter permease [Halomonas ramblicola]|uniref:ABC transporter permease n=1 Tax=Halomonas ramblicola TaxID=747349 RepID=UPI0025B3CBD8|nr:ABC transporter permease [Halomonas ramblicola]MDN3520454.1 ABC transporter permease [Halomonas ramblicola]